MTDIADIASAPLPASLGIGMSHRARSQTVLAQRWSSAGSVGAVGRASVGFGLAVGRSRAIRPTVSFDDLNSAALRPSLHAWGLRQPEPEPPTTASVASVAAPDATETPTAKTPTGSSRHRRGDRALVARTASAPRAGRRRVPEARRPTWTDQVIQRSAIGYTAPPISSAPITEVPDDFVPFGDPKVDQMRLLLRRQEEAERGGAPTPSTSAAAERPTSASVRRNSINDTGGRRGDTVAGRATGPGQFARSMRPEPVGEAGTPAAAAVISNPGTPTAPAPISRSPTPEVVRRQPAARERTARPDKMESLRAMLVEQGILDGATDGPGSDRGATAAGEPEHAARGDVAPRGDAVQRSAAPGQTPSDLASSVDSRRRADTSAALRRAAQSRTTPGDGDAAARQATLDPTGSGDVDRSSSPAARPTASVAPAASRASGTSPSGSAAAALTSAAPAPTSPAPVRDGSSPRATSPVDTGRAGHGDGAAVQRSPAPRPERPGATAALAQQLRAQRLLPTGLAPIARGLAEADGPVAEDGRRRDPGTTLLRERDEAPRSHPIARESLPVGASPVVTSASIDAHQPVQVPSTTVAPSPVSPRRRLQADRPELPGAHGVLDERQGSATEVLRRVTLPRALSTSHRPPVMLPHQASLAPARASTITSAEHRQVAQATSGTSTAASTASGITGRAVPLLEVVRRSALVTASAGRADPHDSATFSGEVASAPVGAAGPHSDRRPTAAAGTPMAAAATTTGLSTNAARGAVPMTAPAVVQRAVDAAEPTAAAASITAPIERPAERVAAQFMTELSRTVRSRPTPLPASFRPLADSIAGPRPVMLSTDIASRRALRSVGKVAATTGDTIHLDRSAIPGAKLSEVMAHELTHIAAPSPAPRFFDDIDDSPEERRAERIGKVMGRSPLAPSASVVAPTTGSRSAVVRRSPARRSTPEHNASTGAAGGGAPTMSAASLAASLVNRSNSSGASAPVIRRELIRREAVTPTTTSTPQIPVTRDENPSAGGYRIAADPYAAAWFEKQLQAQLQPLLRMIEDRMIVELERRGGRTWRTT